MAANGGCKADSYGLIDGTKYYIQTTAMEFRAALIEASHIADTLEI